MIPEEESQDFWWHLDQFRDVLIRIIIVIAVCACIIFCFKETVFSFVLAPKSDSFITYRILNTLCVRAGLPKIDSFEVSLINTGLAKQFIIHVKTALCLGLICASPYILFQLFSFVAPALYTSEKTLTIKMLLSGYIMFLLGIALNYLLIFPLTFRFLGTYQVAGDVANLISLDSYMSTLIIMSLWLGVMFELPVIACLLARVGLLKADTLSIYRRHAIVVILIIAAIITPTSDIVTLLLVSYPIYILYELSILIVKRSSSGT